MERCLKGALGGCALRNKYSVAAVPANFWPQIAAKIRHLEGSRIVLEAETDDALRLQIEREHSAQPIYVTILKWRPPPKDITNDDPTEMGEYHVSHIAVSVLADGERSHLVHWMSYDDDDATWEPEQHVEDTIALDEFESLTTNIQRDFKE